ncbi:flagellar basal-body MS-ring/collar protein FliF [Sediminicurvatus halobius]|uniref:Flagellar M-ring protein n=1 Tax=Sediminicurvatus halobius TaxID=2182432 RepID=A0A2U2MZ77_9GAMM|nr:flagellar basal-body MS-ring/collar protein FliF [Spiribacter halobius]PWG62295.1 flagellar M-ring protein FliF [Spiribacter halobius]UEX79784.1 flagellar M-ring protein FliF [Spiribacter halobius]
MAQSAQAMTQGSAAGAMGGGGMPEQGRLGALIAEYLGPNALRQLGLIIGLAAAVAAGVGLFLWAQEPVHRALFADLPAEDVAAVQQALDGAGIPYRNGPGGSIEVPAGQLDQARLMLAEQGLPNAGGVGFESLRQDQGFGTSRFMENARFQRALETELARTITSLDAVGEARVHLAIPERSVFLRDRQAPRASVTVGLHQGRSLSDRQVNAIAQMVASAVPDLALENVAVVDQRGRLLTDMGGDEGMQGSGEQLAMRQRIEDAYARRIQDLLTPIVGEGNVRAEVSARLDFSEVESTEEIYDPESQVLRSEQTQEQRSQRGQGAMGIPGALTNQPPGAGELEDPAGDAAAAGEAGAEEEGEASESEVVDATSSATRNFEINRTVRHVRTPSGGIQRLSVAVLLDQPTTTNEEGETVAAPFEPERLEEITALVREAVGFDAERGDSVNVVSTEFQPLEAPEPAPTPFWEQPWLWQGGKLLLAALLGLLLIVMVLRPLVNGLLGRDRRSRELAVARHQARQEGEEGAETDPNRQLTGPDSQPRQLPGSSRNYEEQLQAAREVVNKEPALAANVVKGWLARGDA